MYGQQAQDEPVAQGPSPIYIAGSDNQIYYWDPNNSQMQPQVVAKHDAPVKDVYSFNIQGSMFLVSGGWDAFVKFF